MKTLKQLIYILVAAGTLGVYAQQTPAPEQTEAVTIIGATAHIGDRHLLTAITRWNSIEQVCQPNSDKCRAHQIGIFINIEVHDVPYSPLWM